MHPEADARRYDAAVLVLDESLVHRLVRPLELAASEAVRGTVAGWGSTGERCLPSHVRETEVTLVSADEAPIYDDYREGWRGLLIGVREEGGHCRYDSGGPLVSPGERSPLLRGIASGAATERSSWLFPCRVGAFVDYGVIEPWLTPTLAAVDARFAGGP